MQFDKTYKIEIFPFFQKIFLIPLSIGALIGVLISLDPYLTNIIAKPIDLSVSGVNILKLYPFELSTLFFLSIAVLFLLKKGLGWIALNVEKSFIAIYIFGLQTEALIKLGRLDFSEIVIIVYLLLLILKFFVEDSNIKISFLDILNLLFIITVFLPAMNSGIVMLADSFLTLVKFLLLLFLIANFITNRELLVFSLKCIVFFTTISSIIAIFQEAVYVTLHLPIVGFVDKDALRFMFEDTSVGRLLRVPAFCGTYKPFTYYLNTALLIVFNYFIYNRPFELKKRLLLISSFILMFTALMLTFSKDGFLSLALGIMLSLLIWRPYLIIHFLGIIIIGIVAVCVFDLASDIYNKISSDIHYGEQRIRLQLGQEGISGLINKHPWIGVGTRKAYMYTAHFFHWPAHNTFIMAADSVGIMGLFSYLILLGYSFWNLVKLNLLTKEVSDKWIATSLLSGFVALLTTFQFHPFFTEKFLWLHMAIVQAYMLIVLKESSERSVIRSRI